MYIWKRAFSYDLAVGYEIRIPPKLIENIQMVFIKVRLSVIISFLSHWSGGKE